MNQVAIGCMDFDAIAAGLQRIGGAMGIVRDRLVDLVDGHRTGWRRCDLGVTAVRHQPVDLKLVKIIVDAGGRQGRVSVQDGFRAHASAVPELHENPPACLMHRIGDLMPGINLSLTVNAGGPLK